MLTATTELAIRSLILLGLRKDVAPVAPKVLAETLRCSPTYLGKTLGLLVKGGILQSVRGAKGGVRLARDPKQISILAVVEACQGILTGDFCSDVPADQVGVTCRYHQLMLKLLGSTVKILQGCSLAELISRPAPTADLHRPIEACRTWFPGIDLHR